MTFSEDMSYEQLAVWLTNHPKLVGVRYQQDINKLKGMSMETDSYSSFIIMFYCRSQHKWLYISEFG